MNLKEDPRGTWERTCGKEMMDRKFGPQLLAKVSAALREQRQGHIVSARPEQYRLKHSAHAAQSPPGK